MNFFPSEIEIQITNVTAIRGTPTPLTLGAVTIADLDVESDQQVTVIFEAANAGVLSAQPGAGVTVSQSGDPETGIGRLELTGTLENINTFISNGNVRFQSSVDGDNSVVTVALDDGTGEEDSLTTLVSITVEVFGIQELVGGLLTDDLLSAFAEENGSGEVPAGFEGGLGNDTLLGGLVGDVLSGGGDNDLINGNDGNDLIVGGSGGDVLNGEDGDDNLNGGMGDDTIRGGLGNDSLFGDDGNDSLTGDDGSDLISGGAGNDLIDDDTSVVPSDDDNNDTLLGGDGNDTIFGRGGNDVISGGSDNDQLNGNTGDDNIAGDDGDDSLNGNEGQDNLNGGVGADVLEGGVGNDTLVGGAGNDTLLGQDGSDTLEGNEGDDSLIGDSGSTDGSSDFIDGGEGNDFIDGRGGADFIFDGNGNDTIEGGSGNDVIDIGGVGAALVDGGDDDDIIENVNGDDTVTGGAGDDRISATEGENVLRGDIGNDTLEGGAGNDLLIGAIDFQPFFFNPESAPENIDFISGGAGNDTLVGGFRTDILSGDGGNDIIRGIGFGDEIDGGEGIDTLVIDGFQDTRSLSINLAEGTITVFIPDTQIVDSDAPTFAPIPINGIEMLELRREGGLDLDRADQAGETNVSFNSINLDQFDFHDFVTGSENGDMVSVFTGSATILGLGGDDTLISSSFAGNDSLIGGLGADSISAGGGSDTVGADIEDVFLDGGANDISRGDLISFRTAPNDGGVFVDLSREDDQRVIFSNGRVLDIQNFENIAGSDGNDTLLGNTQTDIVLGFSGDDLIEVTSILGSLIDGGDGEDTAFFNVDNPVQVTLVDGGEVFGRAVNGAGQGFDIVNVEHIIGSDVATNFGQGDELTGNDSANEISGLDGGDILEGEGGDDTLKGGDGDDILRGGDGSDLLEGGQGNDVLVGGAGNNVFTFNNQTSFDGDFGQDEISDFTAGQDVIQLFVNDPDNVVVSQVAGSGSVPPSVLIEILGTEDTIAIADAFVSQVQAALQINVAQEIDPIVGGAGNDNLNGDDGANVIRGEGGDDTILGGGGDDTLNGGGGSDTVSFITTVGGVVVTLNAEAVSQDGKDVLNGFENIIGSKDNDEIRGDDNDNILDGGDGDDLIDGGGGSNTLIGGEGNDTVSFTSSQSGIVVALNDIATRLDQLDVKDNLSGFENIIGSKGKDDISGDDNDNTLDGGDGDDLIDGAGGNNTLIGGEGNDTVSFTSAQGGIVVTLNEQAVRTDGTDDLSGFENIKGSKDKDEIRGDENDNILDGAEGDDLIAGGDGIDTLIGEAGNDTLIGDKGGDSLAGGEGADRTVWNNGDGSDFIDGGEGNDTSEVNGADGAGDIFEVGAGGSDVEFARTNLGLFQLDIQNTETLEVNGGGGDDRLTIESLLGTALERIVFDGGAGNDLLDIEGNSTPFLSPLTAAFSVSGASENNQKISVKAAQAPGATVFDGGAGNDTLVGSEATTAITAFGGAGNDLLEGGIGNDSLSGGDDNDTLTGGKGADVFSFASNFGNDVITDFNASEDSIVFEDTDEQSFGTITFTQQGDDVLIAEAGTNNSILVNNAIAADVRAATTEPVAPSPAPPTPPPAPVPVPTPPSPAPEPEPPVQETIEGGDQPDNIVGDDGNEIIDAGAGDDTVDGGAGDDTVIAGDGNDDISGGSGNDGIFAGNGDDRIDAGSGSDTAFAGNGNDQIIAGTGNDTVGGGDGDDNIEGGAGNDIIFGGIGEGSDTLLGGAGGDQVFGGSSDDTVDGGEGDDLLFGGAGDDIVDGGSGEDVIFGSAGNDTVSGGNGEDTFAFITGFGNDVISDFGVNGDADMLNFSEIEGLVLTELLAAATFTDVGATLSIGMHGTILLEGIDQIELQSIFDSGQVIV